MLRKTLILAAFTAALAFAGNPAMADGNKSESHESSHAEASHSEGTHEAEHAEATHTESSHSKASKDAHSGRSESSDNCPVGVKTC
jgi:hypothetical protein